MDLARRRHIALLIGVILAYAFGGWVGLLLALVVASIARLVEVRTREHARMQ